MAFKDAEDLLLNLQTMIKAQLPGRVTAINSEKNDSLVLVAPVDDSYFIQSLDDRMANYNSFVLLGIEEMDSQSIGPGTIENLKISVIIVVVKPNDDVAATANSVHSRRMLRYLRVLRETIEKNWADVNVGAKCKVAPVLPVDLKLLNSSEQYTAAGVTIDVSIA